MYNRLPRHTWVEIDVNQFRTNINVLRNIAKNSKSLLVVKANAYGHGIVEISKCAESMGIDYLGVANVSEGLLLRENGVQSSILVMGYVSFEEIEYAISGRLEYFVWLSDHLNETARVSAAMGFVARVHLKVDIGMGRLGAPAHQVLDLARSAAGLTSVKVVGLATHFPKADIVCDLDTITQIAEFHQVAETLRKENLCPEIVHCANSPATLRFPSAHLNMVRLGIAAYGLRPDAEVALLEGMAPVLSWKAKLGPGRTFVEGTPLSYGGEYRTRNGETVSVAPFGYADGFRRYPKEVNTVLVFGEEARILGRVCMDQCLVSVPVAAGGETGIQATLIGVDGSRRITADNLAERWGTNAYDVVCGINVRVPRIYLED